MKLPFEPYRLERHWIHSGLDCLVILGREAGHRCGYVGVPSGHILHGKDYDSIDVNVHGGLTFSGAEPGVMDEDQRGWWFGFDCAHCDDLQYDPNVRPEDCEDFESRHLLETHRKYFPVDSGHYWTQEEVEREVEKLAAQIHKASRL